MKYILALCARVKFYHCILLQFYTFVQFNYLLAQWNFSTDEIEHYEIAVYIMQIRLQGI